MRHRLSIRDSFAFRPSASNASFSRARLQRSVSYLLTAIALSSCGSSAPPVAQSTAPSSVTTNAGIGQRGSARVLISFSSLGKLPTKTANAIEATNTDLIFFGAHQAIPAGMQATPVAYFRSYTSLFRALSNNILGNRFRYVLLDLEDWSFTPLVEKADPIKYYRLAYNLVKSHGLGFIAAPAYNLFNQPDSAPGVGPTLTISANLYGQLAKIADIVVVQSQGLELNPTRFTDFLNQAVQQIKSSSTTVIIFGGLSSNPPAGTPSTSALVNLIHASMGIVSGYWVNLPSPGSACPKCQAFNPENAYSIATTLMSE